jgi:hypothetical protein
VGKMLVDLKEQGFLAQEKHGETGFNFLTSKGSKDAQRESEGKAQEQSAQEAIAVNIAIGYNDEGIKRRAFLT